MSSSAGTGPIRVTATAIAAAMLSSAFWVAMARGWMLLIGPRFGGEPRPGVDPLLFGFGVLLYLLSLAISYVLAVFEASQDARRRELQVQVLAREAELRSLAAMLLMLVAGYHIFDALQVVTVSVDSPYSHKVWADREGYDFPLLADFWPHGGVARAYGVFNEAAGFANRGTFLIDRAGVIRFAELIGPGESRDQTAWRRALSLIETHGTMAAPASEGYAEPGA